MAIEDSMLATAELPSAAVIQIPVSFSQGSTGRERVTTQFTSHGIWEGESTL